MKLSKKDGDLLFQALFGVLIFIGLYVYVKSKSIAVSAFVTLGLLTITLLALLSIRYYQHKKLKRSEIYEIDKMDGFLFEKYLATLFKAHGYKTKVTKSTGDFGADLILSKNRVKTVVQAKRYKNSVGIQSVQQVVAAIEYYNADRAMVITNSYFTEPTIKLASKNDVELINRNKLVTMLTKLNPDEQSVSKKSPNIPLCPSCQIKMVKRKSRYGKYFYGCANFPRCRQTSDI